MAYIQPNSTIMILRYVPLEPDYEHTLYTSDRSVQQSAFSSFVKYTLSANTYQRVNKNSCRVGIVADNLYDCNYMMFQNTNFGTKWFYAFITGVEYINNECTEITYEIDVMQTYFHNFVFGHCFVEREHSETDALFENYVPESINYGDIVYDNGLTSLFSGNKINIYILAVNHQNPYHNVGAIVENTFSGGNLYAWTIDGSSSSLSAAQSSIQAFLNNYENVPENILGIWAGPALATDYSSNHVVPQGAHIYSSYNTTGIAGNESFGGGFVPKNKKLYCYPYNFYYVTNGNSGVNYHYEYFKDAGGGHNPNFTILASMMPTPECILSPTGYKGCDTFSIGALGESLSIKGWGVGSWTNDTWAQLVRNRAIDFGADLSNPLGLISPIGYAGVVTGGIHSIGRAIAKEDFVPKTTYGSAHSGCALASDGKLTFYGGRARITTEYAKIIDDYFSVYGYQTNRIKVPNTHSRPRWNYVKTGTCELVANETMPADDAQKIKDCMNKGITFWKSLNDVGMYNLDNRPVVSNNT